MEAHLHRNGTRILKFFLHVSKEEQRKRLLKRIDEPEKNWKFNSTDLAERELWDKYMDAYEACLGATSTKKSPWFVVPADDKENARLIISKVILEYMNGLGIKYPTVTPARRKELRGFRKMLEK